MTLNREREMEPRHCSALLDGGCEGDAKSGLRTASSLRSLFVRLPIPLPWAGEGAKALLSHLHCAQLCPALHHKNRILHPAQLPDSG
jgi:hypothetical protein